VKVILGATQSLRFIDMNEEFLSFLWKYGLYESGNFFSEGEKIEIIHPGEHNTDSGPDFFNTRIKIGDTIWVGNAEIHVKASDWNRHNHDQNSAFDNVILHVTYENDIPVYTSKGLKIPAIELTFDQQYLTNYSVLMADQQWIPCGDQVNKVDRFIISAWLNKVGIERLECRIEPIHKNLADTTNNWEEVLYRQISRSFGFHVNSFPFESLAKTTPFHIVKKHAHDLFQLEALFFGQSGFLENDYSDDVYYIRLKKEYEFLKTKYTLRPMDVHLWKFMRLRPVNFPTVRIAQLAALIHHHQSLFSLLFEKEQLSTLYHSIVDDLSEYWNTHYSFGKVSQFQKKTLGSESAASITINTVIPFFFVYGTVMGNRDILDRVLQFLEMISPEDNAEITNWKKVGIVPFNALESQALLQLRSHYCVKRRCLECGIGSRIIRNIHSYLNQ